MFFSIILARLASLEHFGLERQLKGFSRSSSLFSGKIESGQQAVISLSKQEKFWTKVSKRNLLFLSKACSQVRSLERKRKILRQSANTCWLPEIPLVFTTWPVFLSMAAQMAKVSNYVMLKRWALSFHWPLFVVLFRPPMVNRPGLINATLEGESLSSET